MTVLLFLAPVALATGAIVDLWLAGALFEPLRELLRNKQRRWAARGIPAPPDDVLSDPGPRYGPFRRLLDALIPDRFAEKPFLCSHCLSVWAAGLCTACVAIFLIATGQYAELVSLPLLWLGGFRLSWIINMLLPPAHQYPAPEEDPDDDDPARTDGEPADGESP